MVTHNTVEQLLVALYGERDLEVDQNRWRPTGPFEPAGLASSNHLLPSKVEKGRAIQLVRSTVGSPKASTRSI
jgi:hypothetical protein